MAKEIHRPTQAKYTDLACGPKSSIKRDYMNREMSGSPCTNENAQSTLYNEVARPPPPITIHRLYQAQHAVRLDLRVLQDGVPEGIPFNSHRPTI